MLQDLKFALRTLRKNPGFTLVAVIALALGIGANSAIFSVVDALVLRPLPFPHPQELLDLKQGRDGKGPASFPDFVDWRDQSKTVAQMAAWHSDTYILTGRKEPAMLQGISGTANLLAIAGVQPMLGRLFVGGEDVDGKNHVVILSHPLWQKRFGGDKDVIGQSVTLDGESYTVIGVMPRSFRFPLEDNDAELWVPMPHGSFDHDLREVRAGHYLHVVGRLAQGQSPASAGAELATVQARLAQQYPRADAGRILTVTPLQKSLTGDFRPALLVLLGAVGFVLLIACANVANLLLARATVRQREIAIRTALGAGRGRVIKQMLTESVLLALIGGGLGLLLALWGLDALVAVIPQEIPRPHTIALDGRVAAYTFVIAVVTGVVFGLVPALHAAGTSVQANLQVSGRAVVGTRTRARAALLVGEIALAMVLLVGAGLLLRSFSRLIRVDPGFDPSDLLTAGLQLPDTKYKTQDQIRTLYQGVLSRLDSLPGAQASAIGVPLPRTRSSMTLRFELDDRPLSPPDQPKVASMRIVSPSWFRTLGIKLVSGRLFETRDDQGNSPPVIVVNETFARTYWPEGGALGRHVNVGMGQNVMREIVGIARDVRPAQDLAMTPEMYIPFGQEPFPSFNVVVRAPNPKTLEHALAAEVLAVDPGQPIADVQTMDDLMSDSLAQRRMTMVLLAIFATLALVLAAVGIYGVMSYSVTQRTRELGIRMALGAQRAQVLGMVVLQGLRAALIGVAIGLCGALALTRVMSSLLFGVSATDPITFIAIAVLLVGVAALASFLPARRATRVDPMIALRGD